MSFFSGSSSIDASRGIFNNVAGSQISNTYHYNGLFTFQFFSTPSVPPCRHSDNPSPIVSDPEVPSARNSVAISQSFAVADVIEATVRHTAKLAELLINRRVPSNSHLVAELKLLQQLLILNKLAIQAYGDRPLGQCLINMINPAVHRCYTVLQELLDRAGSTWLSSIGINDGWGSIWWNKWDEDELVSLKSRLSLVRRPLGEMLLALNSVSWVELGNEMCAGQVSLKLFHTFLSERLPHLGHIQLYSVQVVDHLGRIIPVPTQFCSSWKEFTYIINGYCRNRPGSCFVERGEYEVMRTLDGQIIPHSEFAVQPGMTLEIAIIIRQEGANQNEKCPRCDYLNLNATVHHGWIDCLGCPAQFQVATVDTNRDEDDQNRNSEVGGPVGEDDGDPNREIISPAFQSMRANSQPQDNDGKQFFRRILLYLNSTDMEHTSLEGEHEIPIICVDPPNDMFQGLQFSDFKEWTSSSASLWGVSPALAEPSWSNHSSPVFGEDLHDDLSEFSYEAFHNDASELLAFGIEAFSSLGSSELPEFMPSPSPPNTSSLSMFNLGFSHTDPYLENNSNVAPLMSPCQSSTSNYLSVPQNDSLRQGRPSRAKSSYSDKVHFPRKSPYNRPASTSHTETASHFEGSIFSETTSGPSTPEAENPSPSSAKEVMVTDAMIQASAKKRKRDTNYFCSQCGASFTTVYAKKRHRSSHSGEKPYACTKEGCWQTFSNDLDRKRHENKSKKHAGQQIHRLSGVHNTTHVTPASGTSIFGGSASLPLSI